MSARLSARPNAREHAVTGECRSRCPEERHRIVIVGGGAGGLELATRLGDRLGRRGRAQVILIDKARAHLWKPLLHEVAAGSMDMGHHELDYLAQAHWHHFGYRVGKMIGLDRKRREVQVAPVLDEFGIEVTPKRAFRYDTLVIAVGSVSNDFGTPGVADYAMALDTPEEAKRFHRRLVDACIRAHAQAGPIRPEQLRIAIVGAGATGVELAAELHRTTRELRLNAMDFELLRRARAEVRRRFELLPDREERLRGLKEGVSLLLAQGDNAYVPKPDSEPVPQPKRKARPVPASVPAPGLFTRLMRRLRFATNLRAVRPGSEFRRLFDANYYREAYPDVAASGANPLWHFVTAGAFEGRNPHPLFDTAFYLGQCAQHPKVNALLDYLEHDDATGPRPHPLFDPDYYVRRYPDVLETRMNPLAHYVLHGAAEGRKPHAMFQPEYYLTVCAEARNGGNPLVHFVESEAAECCSPHPLFDSASYLSAHPEIRGNPLVAYVTRPVDSRGPCEADLGTLPAARFAIQEVEILVVFPGFGFDACPATEQIRIYAAIRARASRDGFLGEAAVVWRDASGGKKFLCAPQQRPFFECVRYDQLAANINGTL